MRRRNMWLAAGLVLLLAGCSSVGGGGPGGSAAGGAGAAASPAASAPAVADTQKVPPEGTPPEDWTLSDFPGCLAPGATTQREGYTLLEGTDLANSVQVLRGAEEGPTIYVVAGVHGDERAGWYAAGLLKQADLKAGTLYILGPANPYGAEQDQRETRDHWDLNRHFPGDPEGVDADKMAAAIYADIQDKAPALVLDLHEARDQQGQRDMLGNSVICQSLDGIGALVMDLILESEAGNLCSGPITLFGSPPVGSVNRTVTLELGIPVITVETYRSEPMAQRVRNHLELTELILERYGLR